MPWADPALCCRIGFLANHLPLVPDGAQGQGQI